MHTTVRLGDLIEIPGYIKNGLRYKEKRIPKGSPPTSGVSQQEKKSEQEYVDDGCMSGVQVRVQVHVTAKEVIWMCRKCKQTWEVGSGGNQPSPVRPCP